MKSIFLIFFLFIIHHSACQVGGESLFQFLNMSTSARQVALGGEVLNIMDDVNQPIWNPAVINSELDNKLSVNYSNFLAGINIGSISYAKSFTKNIGTFHASIKYLDYGSLIGADVNGNELGEFSANDIAISVGYAINIPKTKFFFGTNIKFINSNISNFSSNGIAFDFSFLYYNELKPYSFTLVARNLGKQIQSFNGTTEKLPFKLAFGASYQLQYVPLKWYATFDNLQQWDVSEPNPSNQTVDLDGNITDENIGFINNMFRHLVVGAELFSKRAVNLRFGYNFRRSRELALQNVRTFSGISFGFGIKMRKIKFNYAYSKYHSAANASTFSLLIDLDEL